MRGIDSTQLDVREDDLPRASDTGERATVDRVTPTSVPSLRSDTMPDTKLDAGFAPTVPLATAGDNGVLLQSKGIDPELEEALAPKINIKNLGIECPFSSEDYISFADFEMWVSDKTREALVQECNAHGENVPSYQQYEDNEDLIDDFADRIHDLVFAEIIKFIYHGLDRHDDLKTTIDWLEKLKSNAELSEIQYRGTVQGLLFELQVEELREAISKALKQSDLAVMARIDADNVAIECPFALNGELSIISFERWLAKKSEEALKAEIEANGGVAIGIERYLRDRQLSKKLHGRIGKIVFPEINKLISEGLGRKEDLEVFRDWILRFNRNLEMKAVEMRNSVQGMFLTHQVDHFGKALDLLIKRQKAIETDDQKVERISHSWLKAVEKEYPVAEELSPRAFERAVKMCMEAHAGIVCRTELSDEGCVIEIQNKMVATIGLLERTVEDNIMERLQAKTEEKEDGKKVDVFAVLHERAEYLRSQLESVWGLVAKFRNEILPKEKDDQKIKDGYYSGEGSALLENRPVFRTAIKKNPILRSFSTIPAALGTPNQVENGKEVEKEITETSKIFMTMGGVFVLAAIAMMLIIFGRGDGNNEDVIDSVDELADVQKDLKKLFDGGASAAEVTNQAMKVAMAMHESEKEDDDGFEVIDVEDDSFEWTEGEDDFEPELEEVELTEREKLLDRLGKGEKVSQEEIDDVAILATKGETRVSRSMNKWLNSVDWEAAYAKDPSLRERLEKFNDTDKWVAYAICSDTMALRLGDENYEPIAWDLTVRGSRVDRDGNIVKRRNLHNPLNVQTFLDVLFSEVGTGSYEAKAMNLLAGNEDTSYDAGLNKARRAVMKRYRLNRPKRDNDSNKALYFLLFVPGAFLKRRRKDLLGEDVEGADDGNRDDFDGVEPLMEIERVADLSGDVASYRQDVEEEIQDLLIPIGFDEEAFENIDIPIDVDEDEIYDYLDEERDIPIDVVEDDEWLMPIEVGEVEDKFNEEVEIPIDIDDEWDIDEDDEFDAELEAALDTMISDAEIAIDVNVEAFENNDIPIDVDGEWEKMLAA